MGYEVNGTQFVARDGEAWTGNFDVATKSFDLSKSLKNTSISFISP